MNQTFEDKMEECAAVVRITNDYWIKYQGQLFNHEDFWDDTLHSLDNQFWWNVIDVMKALEQISPEHFITGSRYAFSEVERCLMHEGHKPRCLDSRKNKKIEFKALMHLKDILNSIAGYEPPTKFPKEDKPTGFEKLFTNE